MGRVTAKLKARRSARVAESAVRTKISSSSPLGLLSLHLLDLWRRIADRGLLFIASDQARAERLGMLLHGLDPQAHVLVFPRPDTLPFDAAPASGEIAGRRASVLRRITEESERPILISTAEALLQRVPKPESWRRASLRLRPGARFEPERVEQWLADSGYELGGEPDYPGNALLQSQLLEVFPGGALGPVRIEHADGTVRSITSFDPGTRSAIASLSEMVLDPIAPMVDVSGRRSASVFDYLPSAVLIGDSDVGQRADRWLRTIAELVGSKAGTAPLFLTAAEWQATMQRCEFLPAGGPERTVPYFALEKSAGTALAKFVKACRRDGRRVIFTAAVAQDLRRLERLVGTSAEHFPTWSKANEASSDLASVLIDFEQGFVLSGEPPIAVVAAADALGSRARHLQPMAKPWLDHLPSDDLPKAGDLVVHAHRGLAVLAGLEPMNAAPDSGSEMARLMFADNEAILVPASELALVWPYGADPDAVARDKADGSSWAKRFAAAAREVELTAAHILAAVEERRREMAPRIVPPAALYERFAARFPHIATPDQATAIDDVLKDLASGHPMDRVICGDVGFGKTEVALRATAAAVFSGFQAAIVAPTTVLAQQHATTFRKRFAPFGVEVGLLSRFSSAPERRDIKAKLKSGALQVVVGTHAVGAGEISFAQLGLVVIDEEQHFGAAQKKKLFALGRGVHRLSMSATPIPRTLASTIAGLTDVSIIATAPVQRTGVVTTLGPLSDHALASALRREHRRHGQSFVICPRISDTDPMFGRLRRIAPELTILRLHGRMPAQEIDQTMMEFVEGRADVLLATNVVENGLDIPRANTMLICWPERFGLAQLHQLRGRVGRGGARAFAHLLTDDRTETAHKRLAALKDLSKPGAGFRISARDFELRGGGDFLSEAQSGHVTVFGPALYRWLLSLALKGKSADSSALAVPELRLGVTELLPVEYVSNEATRLEIYLRLARCSDHHDIDAIEDELDNRFGKLPEQAAALLGLARLRLECQDLGITRLEAGPSGVAATFASGRAGPVRPPLQIGEGGRVILKMDLGTHQRLAAAKRLLTLLHRTRRGRETARVRAPGDQHPNQRRP
jgi:transcription-repair coupling factor (superfamily II helicase)